MNALEQAAAYANDAECPVIARAHIQALLEMVYRAPLSEAPCDKCGYNGRGYYQPDTHKCARPALPVTAQKQPFDEAKEREMFEAEMLTSDWPAAQVAMRKRADGNTDMYHDSCANIQWQTWLARARIAAERSE